MSLDLLAHVATKTLENSQTPKKAKKNVMAMEVLDLDQIKDLPDKALVGLFSEFSSNEISRTFTFTCCLMPLSCQEKFSSFASENRARNEIRTHLIKHVEELVDEAYDPNRTTPFKFTAQTVVGRRRLTTAKQQRIRKMKRNVANTIVTKSPTYTVLKTMDKDSLPVQNIAADTKKSTVSSKSDATSQTIIKMPKSADVSEKKKIVVDDKNQDVGIFMPSTPEVSICNVIKPPAVKPLIIMNSPIKETPLTLQQSEAERRIEENKQFIIDLLSRSQPYHDHSYTSTFGKKRGIGVIPLSDSDEEYEQKSICTPPYLKPVVRPIPMLLFSCDLIPPADVGPIATQEVFIHDEIDDTPTLGQSSHSSYTADNVLDKWPQIEPKPPSFSADLNEDEDLIDVISPVNYRRKRPSDILGSSEWERKMALHCINELRDRKKFDRMPLCCKICNDKSFTAAATLTYHYRSHAGIKPFVCLICNTTFTRQHSLNYHMLIHNNQSRFTCKDCGRRFRHPSHFKEHLRRHTGETPYQCVDCSQRFKTRNTYKRHLKTRHGKLLSMSGIQLMRSEDFIKVRTHPRRPGILVPTNSSAGDFIDGLIDDPESVISGKVVVDSIEGLQQLFQGQTASDQNTAIVMPVIKM